MRNALRWLVVAGCYDPTIHSGAPCLTVCPGDLVCIDHVCHERGYVPPDAPDAAIDGPTVDGPPGDGDADGISDAADNCPARANVDQHDEDGDALGDVCDPCPQLAGTAVDSDGDDVGDACDPQPSIPKQRWTFFDPFTSLRPEWDHQGGVTVGNDQMRMSGSAFTRLAIATGELRIDTAGTIAAVDSQTPHQLTIAFGFTGADFHYCELYDTGGSTGDIAITEYAAGSYSGLAGTSYPGVLPTGA